MLARLALPILIVLPGCWPVFAFRRSSFRPCARLALAVVLSPVVCAAVLWSLMALGVAARPAALLLVLLSLTALVPTVRALRDHPVGWRAWAGGAAVFGAVATCLALPWLLGAAFRQFSWHGLLHTDIIYALARSAVPEEPELAGLRLAYPWAGHLYWLALAAAADISPTAVYAITNVALAGATGVLYGNLARELGASREGALTAPVILALGIGWTGIIGWSLLPPNDSGLWWALLGDLRHAPFLQKFSAFEVMVFGLAAFVGLANVAVVQLRRRATLEVFLAPLLFAGLAALYPLLLIPAVVLLAGVVDFHVLRPSRVAAARAGPRADVARASRFGFARTPLRRRAVVLVVTSVAAVALGAFFLALYSADRTEPAARLSALAAIAKKSVFVVLATAPFAAACVALWHRSTPDGRRRVALLAATALASIAANVLLRLPSLTEYKFIFTAGVCLIAPAVVGLERTVLVSALGRRALLVGMLAVLALAMTAYSLDQTPQDVARAPAIRESAFGLRLAASEPDAGWTDAVRQATPANAVLLVHRPDLHVSSFTGRALLAPGRRDRPHAGYSLDSDANLVRIRGYDPAFVAERTSLLEAAYAREQTDPAGLLARLRTLARPLALVVGPGDPTTFIDWLSSHRIGRRVHDEAGYVVHLIERD